jgi:redox-sensitive bicupin YhaK (pirin superfamily)
MSVPLAAPVEAPVPQRTLGRVRTLPAPSRGQFGPHHTAVEVIRPSEWADADPFILLMDDRSAGRLEAGPHPHAGFETVSFLVEGDMPAEHGDARLSPGDVEWTTAGSGIVHGPDAPLDVHMRLLQLWLNLPSAQRWTEPDHQFVRRAEAPVRREPGVEVRLYSGTTGTLASPTRNRVPVTLADVSLAPGAQVAQELPASYNGFLYVLEGQARVGPVAQALVPGQVGWLARAEGDGATALTLSNPGPAPLRVLLYAGQRQGAPLAWYGPFIGETREDLARAFERYQTGTFRRV